jgi:hypothetical protein
MDSNEFEAFIGIVPYLEGCSYPIREAIWRAGIKGCALIKQIMTLDRFSNICRALHRKDRN